MLSGRPTPELSSAAFNRLFTRLPKAEIHVHLEGSVSAARLRSWWPDIQDAELPLDPGTLFEHRSFAEFLKHFGAVTRAIRRPEDLAQIAGDLCRSFERQGVVAAEVFFTPVIFTRRGLPFLEVFDAIEEVADLERRRGGPSLCWILDAVRQWGPAGLEELLECARAARGRILGIGVGGDEGSVPAVELSSFFEEARRMGLRTVAHAGEFCPAWSVREAVEILGAERIGHGIRALEDPAVIDLLRRRDVPLEVCPTSNLRTRVIERWCDHPLRRMVDAGLRVSLNSDDPGLFNTGLLQEYHVAHHQLGLPADTLYQIHCEGLRASFLPAAEKRRLLAQSRKVWEEEEVK